MTVRRRTKGPGTWGGLGCLLILITSSVALLLCTILLTVLVLYGLGVVHHLHY